MDFIEGHPQSGAANAILVVVDKFSKFSHFLPLKHPFSAKVVAQLFLDTVYRLHSMPKSIISDRDRVFTGRFWQLYQIVCTCCFGLQALNFISVPPIIRIRTGKGACKPVPGNLSPLLRTRLPFPLGVVGCHSQSNSITLLLT